MKRFVCESDIGSVLVGSKEMQFAIPHGAGDGSVEVIVYEQEEVLDRNGVRFLTCLSGKFNIFTYDCCHGEKEYVAIQLNGRYGVFIGDRQVIFQKWYD